MNSAHARLPISRVVRPSAAWRIGWAVALLGVLLQGCPALANAAGRAMRSTGASSRTTVVSGTVTYVVDGDTLWLRIDSAGAQRARVPVRLLYIDAPERCQAGGAEATAALQSRVLQRNLTVHLVAKDVYGRWLGELRLDGIDINRWMVSSGHAWSASNRKSPGRYAAEEHSARAARRGLFSDAGAIRPGVFRKQHGACG